MGRWSRWWKHRRDDSLLAKAMSGQLPFGPSLVFVILGIREYVPHPGRLWRVRKSAIECYDNRDAIVSARKAVIGGRASLDTSTFDVMKDTWCCYLAFELNVDRGRVACVEVLDPYALEDCGQLLEVAILEGMHELPMTHGREWMIDIESASVM